jgi:hypothetical protein
MRLLNVLKNISQCKLILFSFFLSKMLCKSIESILDLVLSSSRQKFYELTPFRANLQLGFKESKIFLLGELGLDYRRVQMVDPSLSTLLSRSLNLLL